MQSSCDRHSHCDSRLVGLVWKMRPHGNWDALKKDAGCVKIEATAQFNRASWIEKRQDQETKKHDWYSAHRLIWTVQFAQSGMYFSTDPSANIAFNQFSKSVWRHQNLNCLTVNPGTRRLQHASECCAHCQINFKYVNLFGNCRITAQWLKDKCNPKHLRW